jgi:Tol biopolymer transport system component
MTILDATTGQEIKSDFGHQGWAPATLSPDGKWLAFTGGASWFIEFQNIENMSFSGKYLVPMSYSDRYSSYHSELPSYGSWSHDGQRFAVYDGYSLQIYDTTNIDGLDHVSIISIECSNTKYPIVIWSPDDRRILITTNFGGVEILALDSDGDRIPDYRDVLPTVNKNIIIFSNLVAAAVILWTTVLLSHRPRRTKAL